MYYVGSSEDITGNSTGRWYHHKYMLRNNIHSNLHLQRAWNKYGSSNFLFKIVEEATPANLLLVEQTYLDTAKKTPNKCYNISFIAGKIEMTDDIKKKIGNSQRHRLKIKTNHPMYGKHHSKETKILLRKNSPRHGTKNGMYGKKRYGKENPNFRNGDKIVGNANPNYNPTKHIFKNTISNEIFIGTRYEFKEKYGFDRTSIRDLINNKKQSLKKWIISPVENSC